MICIPSKNKRPKLDLWMMQHVENALKKYKAGDFHGIVREHGPAASESGTKSNQTLLVLVAQSLLKIGAPLDAAPATFAVPAMPRGRII